MNQIDLDDVPPKVAKILERLVVGDELQVVQGGALIARLTVAGRAPAPDSVDDLPPEEAMAEVMDQFKAMIEDEF
jgi:antitoxin (DNA-binding transcriptional repressor) of toxin-antitoxin stability system